jgi:hypothetical protein
MTYRCLHCSTWLDDADIETRLVFSETRWEPAEYESTCLLCGGDEIDDLSRCVECDDVATEDDWCEACFKAGIANGTIEVIA